MINRNSPSDETGDVFQKVKLLGTSSVSLELGLFLYK